LDIDTQERILELLDEDKTANEIVKILKDEDNIKISKATINRTRRLTKVLGDDKKLTPDERDVYLSYMRKQNEKKEKRPWYIRFSPLTRTPADGPYDDNMPDMAMDGHQSFLNNYIPRNSIEAVDVDVDGTGKILSTPTPFTARTLDSNENQPLPKFFWNPYTALDLIVFQDVYTHTICGTVVDVVVAFLVGMGIKPVLKLVNPHDVELKDIEVEVKEPKNQNQQQTQDPEKSQEIQDIEKPPETPEKPPTKMRKETKEEAIVRELDENENLLDPLIALDRWIGEIQEDDDDEDGIKEDWNTKVEALVRNHYIFGRDLMTRELDKDNPFTWNDKKWPDIETIYKVQHPRDINFIEISQKTFNIKRVSLMFSASMLDKDDMIYLAHMEESPIYNGKGYGYSLLQRMLGHGRSLRKLIDRDFPNVASVGYAPFTIIATKRDEKGTKNEASQGQAFVNGLVTGQPNHTSLKDPQNDLVVHTVDLKPDIPGMISMAHFHAESAAKVAQVPTALIAKEKDPNRDTLLGILRVFAETEIPRKRLPIIKVFTNQYYMRNFKKFYKDKPETLKKYRVEAEFTDAKIDSWADIVGAFLELNKIFRFKAEAAGKILNIENLEGKIHPEKEPLGESSMMQDADGNTLTMSKGPPKPKKST